MSISLPVYDYAYVLLLITKDDCMLKRPLTNRIKVSACVQRAEVWPMSFKSIIVFECKDTSVTLTHQVGSQELNAVV